MLHDLRFAARGLRRSPSFSIAIVLTLALGVGATTGAFSALYTLLLQPLPYPEPQRLVALYETTVDRQPRDVAQANLLDWQRRTASFEAMAAYRPRSFGLTLHPGDQVAVIQTAMVMADFFRVVAIPPALGRAFTTREEVSEAHLLILGDRMWRTRFAADPSVVGTTVGINEEPYTIIGVMPAGFEYPTGNVLPDAFLPLSRKDYCCARLGSLATVARLKPGVTLRRARTELAAVAAALSTEYPATNRARSAGLKPLDEAFSGSRREPLTLLMAAAALLLIVACANATGLVLARSLSRTRETSIRIALGAGPGRLLRQSLAEALLIGAAADLCGLLAAQAILHLAPRFIPTPGHGEPLPFHGMAFAFSLLLALAAAAVLGLAPLLPLRRSMRPGRWASPSRLRTALVVAQVALSTMLLLGAGLLLRSFLHLVDTSPGFAATHVHQFGIGLPEKRYDTELKMVAFHRELLRRLSALPGVESAGAVYRLPLAGITGGGGAFQFAGDNIPLPQRPRAWTNLATPGYFSAMGIPLLQGRTFSWQDDHPGANLTAIVNQAFVRAYLHGRQPLGTALDIRWVTGLTPLGSVWTIVGVASDTHQNSMDRDPVPEIFLSMTQLALDGGSYVIRTRGDNPALPQAIAATVAGLDPLIERVGVKPLSLVVERSLGRRRGTIQLVGGFGLLALLLCAVGIYGMVVFRAAQRSREMAIRMALGATGGQIQRLVLGHAVWLAAGGTALGIAAFLPSAKFLANQLYGVTATDLPTLLLVAVAVFLVALAASWMPARRAVHTAPVELLHDA